MTDEGLSRTREALQDLQLRLEQEEAEKLEELKQFKQDTLGRLNSLSEHSIELARKERLLVEADLERDRADWKSRIESEVERLSLESFDDAFLEPLAELAFQELLPPLPNGTRESLLKEEERS
ncbi:MAG: hypothetical protein GX256_08525 [Fretibacterium sp.]|nr:hypothetical protein [Fretibacterium sp.]